MLDVRWPLVVRVVVFLCVLGGVVTVPFGDRGRAQSDGLEVIVTSADDVAGDDAECPSETGCTLRKAIETLNRNATSARYTVRFDPAVFSAESPVAIEVGEEPLPAILRSNVTIDARGAGVVIDGEKLAADSPVHGLDVAANGFAVHGLTLRGFSGACIRVTGKEAEVGGSRDQGMGNSVDGCAIGIAVQGDDARVFGNDVGLRGRAEGSMATGILVRGQGSQPGTVNVGSERASEANAIGNAEVGLAFVGDSAGRLNGGVLGNRIGEDSRGNPLPVDVGIRFEGNVSDVAVGGNRLRGVRKGITLVAGAESTAPERITIRHNTYRDVGEMAIDLGDDGPTPGDPNDEDEGPNALLNAPAFDDARQERVSGVVMGPCAGCRVDLYLAERRLDGRPNVPTSPIAGVTTTTNAAGEFTFWNPPVAPGQWIMAVATDRDGNTSEFGFAARVGTGILQCSDVILQPGWNIAGFFGGSERLGSTFPNEGGTLSPVRSIHSLRAGSRQFDSWYAASDGFNGLSALTTGQPYWFYAAEPVTLEGSFTLTDPLPVVLRKGWNDFLYIGAEEDVRNALASIGEDWEALYRWTNDGVRGRWQVYGGPAMPSWVRGFETMTPCAAYTILVSEDTVLFPPQP